MGTEIKFDTVAPNGYVWFYFINPKTKKKNEVSRNQVHCKICLMQTL